jgi:hypothetical protein
VNNGERQQLDLIFLKSELFLKFLKLNLFKIVIGRSQYGQSGNVHF